MSKINSKWMSKVKKTTKGGWKRAANTKAKARGQKLPAGIVRGVARLVSIKTGETDRGVPTLSFKAEVMSPEESSGITFFINHRFQETAYRSLEENLERFSSDLQLLGADTEGTSEDDWGPILEELEETKPFFLFNSFEWEANGRTGVSATIQGLAEDWEDDSKEEENHGMGPAPWDQDNDDQDNDDQEEDDQEEDDPEDQDDDDPEDDDPEDDDQDFEPQVGDVWNYKATARSKPKEVEVLKVNLKAKTVDLKVLETGKTIKKVSWDDLIDVE